MIDQLEKPRLIVVAGPNGSGKTSITEQLLLHKWMQGCVYINPDRIAQDEFGDWNSLEAIKSAADKADAWREQCLEERLSLAFETVMSAPNKVEFVARAKERGFFVRVFFVCTESPTINASRVAQRVMAGGHDVPIPKIIGRYSKSIANCARVIRHADRVYLYDNSVDRADPRLILKVKDGSVAKIYSAAVPAWAQTIIDAFSPQDDGVSIEDA